MQPNLTLKAFDPFARQYRWGESFVMEEPMRLTISLRPHASWIVGLYSELKVADLVINPKIDLASDAVATNFTQVGKKTPLPLNAEGLGGLVLRRA